jgi:hypothetical protein
VSPTLEKWAEKTAEATVNHDSQHSNAGVLSASNPQGGTAWLRYWAAFT